MIRQAITKTTVRSNLHRAFVASLASSIVAAVALLSACAPGAGLIGGACAEGFVECGGACVSLTDDHDNCGACGRVCSGASQCGAGACQSVQSASAITSCAKDNAFCTSDGACRDLQHDPNNCGACGALCTAGDVCAAGKCAKLEAGLRDCTPDNVRCGEACRDVRFDPSNCGECGSHCAGTDRCTNGVCGASVSCAAGNVTCDGKCSNPKTDVANCGSCGVACGDDDVCVAGECMAKKHCAPPQQ